MFTLNWKSIIFRQIPKYRSKNSCFYSTVEPKPFEAIPGLKSLPVLGIMHHFIPIIGTVGLQKNFFGMMEILHKKYGAIAKLEGLFGRGTLVIFFEPELYDQIYRAEDATGPLRPGAVSLEYYRETLRKDTFDGVYGLTTAQGEKWRSFRTKVNPALLKPKLVKLYTPGLEKIADDVIERIIKIKDTPAILSREFESEISKYSLEAVALVGLGTRLGCLRDDLTDDDPANQLMECAKKFVNLSYKLEFSPSFMNRPGASNFQKIIEVYDIQWKVSQMLIEQARQRIQERGHEIPEEDQSVIEKLLAIDEKVAVMMANEMLFAGIDTVSFSIIGLLYHLAKNPEAQEKLRFEIRSETTSRYLKACLKESLRLMPVLPANLRETSKEHIVGGYHIPKGIFAIAPNEYLSRSEKHYPQAKEFIPGRWLVDKSNPLYYGNTHPMVTLPFGFGVRSCIGRRIAELEIEILLKKLLSKFEVSWTGPPINVVTKLVNEFKGPTYFQLVPI